MSQITALPSDWTKALEHPRQITARAKDELAQKIFLTSLLDGHVHGFERGNILAVASYTSPQQKQGSLVTFRTQNGHGGTLDFVASEMPQEISKLFQGSPTDTQRAKWKEILLRLREEERANMEQTLKNLRDQKQGPINQRHENLDKPQYDNITKAVQEIGVIRARREARWPLPGKAFAAVSGKSAEEKQEIADLHTKIERARDLRQEFLTAKNRATNSVNAEYQMHVDVVNAQFSAQDVGEWLASEMHELEVKFAEAMESYETQTPDLASSLNGNDHFVFETRKPSGVVLDFQQRRVHTNNPQPQSHAGRHHDL